MIWNTSETVSITAQPFHSHFCCWLVPIWPNLDFCAENGAYGLCRLGWWYNGAKLSFSWRYMIVSMIWNTSKTVCITPQPCHSHFCCWLLLIWPYLDVYTINDMKHFLTLYITPHPASVCFHPSKKKGSVPAWLAVQRSKVVFLLTLYYSTNDMKYFQTVCITPQQCHSHFWCWLLPIWP